MQIDGMSMLSPSFALTSQHQFFLGSSNQAAIAAEPQDDRNHHRDGKNLREYNRGELRGVKRTLQQWHPCMHAPRLACPLHRLSHYDSKPIADDDDCNSTI